MLEPGKIQNRARMAAGYFLKKDLPGLFPQEIVIELTNHCNLACVMCPHREMTRKKGFMEWSLFEKIINEARTRAELVYLYGTGESLLHEKLYDCIRYAAGAGLSTVLSTNGTLMGPEAAENLLTSGLDFLVVALDGGVRETYERIRVRGSFDTLVANVRTLARIKQKTRSKTNVCIQMIQMPENRREVRKFQALFDEAEKRQINHFRFKPLFETYADPGRKPAHTRPCYLLWNMMAVLWDGRVALCCMDYDGAEVLGDLSRQSIGEVWNAEAAREKRRLHRALSYENMALCGACDIPEQGYFSNWTILGSAALSAARARRLMPAFEKIFLMNKWSAGKP